MASKPPPWTSNPRVVEELQTKELLINAAVSAERLWEQVLSDDDRRRRLGGDLQESYAKLRTTGMWMKLRRCSQERAIVDVAYNLGLLDKTKYEWLLREIGGQPPVSPSPNRPRWEETTGELRWKNKLIRRVRVLARSSNIQAILTAFEENGWPYQVRNPLPDGQQQLHQALRSLNQGLQKIRFHALKGGQTITWKPA